MDNEKRVASFKLQLLFDLVTQRVFFPWGTNSVFNVELQKEMKKKVMSKNVKGIHRELSDQKNLVNFFSELNHRNFRKPQERAASSRNYLSRAILLPINGMP